MIRGIKNIAMGFAVTACLFVAVKAYGQDYIPAWKISAGGGYMNYFGDVSPYTIKGWEDWGRVFKFFQYNKYYVPKASLSISVERYLSPGITLMLQANRGYISMSDRYRQPDGRYDKKALHWDRALNFETKIQDVGLDLVFRSNNGRLFPVHSFLAPYFFLGGGMTHFTVKGDLYDEEGKPYNYASPDVKPDGVYETALRPLMTETPKEYPDVVPYVNAGLGLSLNMSHRVSLSVQTDIKYAFSDYLDDVSGQYKEKYPSSKTAYAAHPGTNIAGPFNRNRGNHDGVNDFYIFNKLSLSINLGNKADHYFHAPVIYLPGSFRYNDSLAMAPSPPMSPDSSQAPAKAVEDSGALQIARDLGQIRAELLSLRFAHIDQNYIIRQNEARDRLEVLQEEKAGLSAKEDQSAEDSLKIALDDYLIDSLHHSLAAIHEARSQLRRDMAYSPIVTEYDDSTKIMIYKGPRLQRNSGYLTGTGETDTLRYSNDGSAGAGSRKDRFYRSTGADSVREELSRLEQEAVVSHDTALAERLQLLSARLDSAEARRVNATGGSGGNEYELQQDSLKILVLERQSDSLRRADYLRMQEEPQKRNVFQRFFDQFNRKPHDGRYPANQYTQPVYDPAAAQLLQQNQDEINRLQEQIGRLRTYSSPVYSAPPAVIFREGNDRKSARQERRDRRRTNAFNQGLIAAIAGRGRQQPTLSPNIILPPGYDNNNNNTKELEDLRDEVNALRRQYDTAQVSNDLWAQRILADTAAAGDQHALIGRLRSKVDSLSGQLAALKRANAADTARPVYARKDNALLLHYPTVSMYFATGTAVLDPAEKQKIGPIAAAARDHPQVKLLITGLTDGTGNKRINAVIAQKRCDAVRQILIKEYGIAAGRLESRTDLSGSKGSNSLMRRVDIRFLP